MDVQDELARRLAKVEQDLAVIKSNYATKADVLEAKASVIMWVVGSVFFAQLMPFLLKKIGA